MVFETKEQIIKRKKVARYRFRALIRKAHLNSFWLSELDDMTLGEDVAKNITIILKRSQQKRGLLTIHEKASLRKPPADRTYDEVSHLEKLFDGLLCLKEIPPMIRKKLIDVVEFQYFEKDRLILMEGHMSLSMHFILTGEVLVSKLTYDKEADAIVNLPVNILGAGASFGQIALIRNSNRVASVSTKSDCEFLCVYKEDFERLLRESMETKHENVKASIRRFEYFKNFSDEKITECCAIAKIEQFNPQQIIYSQGDISNFSYFVLSGKCMILQCLKIRERSKGKPELVVAKKKLNPLEIAMAKLPPRETGIASMIETDSSDVQHQFVDVGTYNCGGIFGIGEEMENRIIIARNVVQCLMIPRYWLFQKAQNIGNVWTRIKLFLNSSVPSQQKLFENFLSNQKWKKYKKKTIEEIKRQHGIDASNTNYYNIPVICRIEES